MKLRHLEFRPVWNASGARGFFGEGYWYHRYLRPFGLRYDGATFVAKTTTLHPRPGNMPLGDDLRPREWFPRSIVVKVGRGVALNAVGLSGPGLHRLVEVWAQRPQGEPWFISIMSVGATPEVRLSEIEEMVAGLAPLEGRDDWGLQVNLSCPNVGLDPGVLAYEARGILDRTARLERPTLLKLNALFPVEAAKAFVEHPDCDGIVVSNTIPWGKLPDKIDWRGLFGSDVSPLQHLGGGGLSGKPLLPIVAEWITEARQRGITKTIVGGGGILSKGDAETLLGAGANAVELGSISFLRPWRVASVIRYVNRRQGSLRSISMR